MTNIKKRIITTNTKEMKNFIEESRKFFNAQAKKELQGKMQTFGAKNRPAKVLTQSAYTFSRVKCC